MSSNVNNANVEKTTINANRNSNWMNRERWMKIIDDERDNENKKQ